MQLISLSEVRLLPMRFQCLTVVETLCSLMFFKSITSLKFLDKKHVFGKGNFHDIGQKIRRNRDVTAAVLGLNMLNSVQLASLQDEWGVPIYDRCD